MSVRAQLFVEGVADVKFLEDYLMFLGITDITVSNTMNGKDGILKLRPLFEINTGRGIKNILIIDADADFQKRKEELASLELLKHYEVTTFLFPNNKDSGDLEILLEQIIHPNNAVIFECWDVYENCLNTKEGALTPSGKYTTPDRKAKIFAYLGALSVGSDEQKEKYRNYLNKDHWDLNAKYLNPLKQFIQNI